MPIKPYMPSLLAFNLKYLRVSKGLTRKVVVEMFKEIISEGGSKEWNNYLNAIENGFFVAAPDKVAALAKIYEVEVNDLYSKRFAPIEVEFDDLKRPKVNFKVFQRLTTFNSLERLKKKAEADKQKIIEIKIIADKTPINYSEVETIGGVAQADFGECIVPAPRSPLYNLVYPEDMYLTKQQNDTNENV